MKLYEIEERLRSFGAQNPRQEAGILLEEYFGVSPARLLTLRDEDFSSPSLDKALKDREARIPLQHILGKWEFMGKEFYVSKDCLIPRPDTEILVEKAIEIVKTRGGVDGNAECRMQNAKLNAKCKMQNAKLNAECRMQNAKLNVEAAIQGEAELRVADLCTGSGCIGLSLLMYGGLEKITLMDISDGALKMATKNAQRHGLEHKCRFILGDITKDMPNDKFDLIVSNPPYIPTSHISALSPEVQKEPALALDGGEDGLDIIRFLIGDGLGFLKENGAMLIEFGYDQGDTMDTLLREKRDTGSIKSYEILRDYGNNPRVAVIYAK